MYIQYIRVRKMMIKNQRLFSLLGELSKDAPAAKNFGITHLDDPILYISSKREILLMVQVAETFVKNDKIRLSSRQMSSIDLRRISFMSWKFAF